MVKKLIQSLILGCPIIMAANRLIAHEHELHKKNHEETAEKVLNTKPVIAGQEESGIQ